jgi:serine/threonine protein kinase
MSSILNNRYRLEKLIGEGGFARVFLATDLELGRQVAIKVLEQSWVTDSELLTRFRNEARAVAVLDHPNILPVYDSGVAEGTPYIIMPYISGGTLADRMKEGPFTFDEIGFYLDQISSALDYAHERGIVHRDVKPTNLLMRPNGQLVLMDFGLAKLLENASVGTKTGVMGTVAYMAPEQLFGFVSTATDIYMLGLILYQMLAGKLPFTGNTDEIIAAHVRLAPASLAGKPTMRSVSPLIVQALDQVVTKALAKTPADRYQTCQALCFAYFSAMNADPAKAPRLFNHEKKLDVRHLAATVIEPVNPSPASPQVQSPTPALLDATIVEPLNLPFIPQPQPPTEDQDATVIAPPSQPKKILLKPPCLLVTTEPDKGFHAKFDLVGETLSLGRAKDNDLRLPHSIISRHHAVFQRLNSSSEEASYKIVQGQSINPLRFKGKRVTEKVLEHGDVIEVGERGYAHYIIKLTYQAAEYGIG